MELTWSPSLIKILIQLSVTAGIWILLAVGSNIFKDTDPDLTFFEISIRNSAKGNKVKWFVPRLDSESGQAQDEDHL